MLSLDVESLIRYGGVFLLCLLTFCSVGLFFCFFLPIGGVLFAAGVMVAAGGQLPSLFTVCSLLVLSSIAGSVAGYVIGRSTGKFFYTRKDSRFFRQSYLTTTEAFYNKYGSWAMIAGYILPIIRTFAPVLGGIIKVQFSRFLIFNIIGSIVFISMYVLSGYLIGSMPFLKPWLKYIVVVFILVVTVPVVVKIVRTMRGPKGV
jgi:membrane-associated protein